MSTLDSAELLATLYDDGDITEVIRPAAIIPEDEARAILAELALADVDNGGRWRARPALWSRYDRGWPRPGDPGNAVLVGTIQAAYGTPTRHEITIYRATVTQAGATQGWTVELLCDDALRAGGLTLATCPRAELAPPPKPFRF